MGIEDERASVWRAIEHNGDRITELHEQMEARKEVMRETIREAVQDAMPSALLTDDELHWVQLAIKKESQSVAFRQAIIEKTFSGVLLLLLATAGGFMLLLVQEYAAARGWKKP